MSDNAMNTTRTIVILGGTTEARKLADQLADTLGDSLPVITALVGASLAAAASGAASPLNKQARIKGVECFIGFSD